MAKKKQQITIRSSAAEYLTFVAASGESGVEAIYADENVWLTQKMIGVLYHVETHTINYHLKKIFKDNELSEDSVIRKFRITAADGKTYDTKHYNLKAIIAAGYKMNSENELAQLERIVTAYLELAESMALRKIPMTMADWEVRLNRFIELTDLKILQDAGRVTAELAKEFAESEFEKYRIVRVFNGQP